MEKSDFSCSLKPEIKIPGKCIDFFVFQKKKFIFICFDFINIAFLWETKVHMENSVIFGRFLKK